MTPAFTPERIAQLRANTISGGDWWAALDEIERLSAERDKAKADAELCAKEWAAEVASGNARLEQLKTMAAQLSRVKAERDEAVTLLAELAAQASNVGLGISIKRVDVSGALEILGARVDAAYAFLSRMEGRKDG